MRTNIVIDDKLLNEAFNLSSRKTKKDLIHEALEEYVVNHKMKNLMDLKGKISFSESYDYKALRKDKYNSGALREGEYNNEALREDEYNTEVIKEGE